jgi:hypothetical protein
VPGFREALTRRLLAPGAEFILFSEGVRVGRLTVAQSGLDDRYCTARPTVTGTAELVPSAAGAQRLLALPVAAAAGRPYGDYQALDDTYEQRLASLSLGSAAVTRTGAAWPPSLLESRADIQAFQLQGASGPSIAATFLYHDQLSPSAPGANAYALLTMGTEAQGAYRSDYVWYRKADSEGKGAPRYFSHLDLNGDGQEEVVLDVFGSEARWFAVLGRRSGAWVRTFQDPCGGSSPNAGG